MNVIRWDTARTFDALAHVEFEMGQNPRFYVTPPNLALLPTVGLPVALLTGARSQGIIERLLSEVKKRGERMDLQSQPQPDPSRRFPSRLTIMGESVTELQSLASDCGFGFANGPAGWCVLGFAAGLSTYLAQGEWMRTARLNWEALYFRPELCRFAVSPTGADVELIKYVHPSRQYAIYYLFRGDSAMRVDPDWGRFAIFENTRRNVLLYDAASGRLLVPITTPLPKLIARGLSLCSGVAARNIPATAVRVTNVIGAIGFKMYADVPPNHAAAAAQRLGQTLTTGFTFVGNDDD